MKISKDKYLITLIILFIILIISITFFSVIGSANIRSIDVFRIIISKTPIVKDHVDISDIPDSHIAIIWNIRLPRVLLGVIVGASLSIAGAAFQGLFKNPMADPYVIGISSGAAFGATIAIVLGISFSILGISAISLFAFLGAMLAVIIVVNISRYNAIVATNTLLLAGIAIGQFLTAIMSLMMVLHSKDMAKIVYWTMGSLAGKGWKPLVAISFPALFSMFIIYLFAKDLNIILTGDESAKSLGVDVEKVKLYILTIGTFMVSLVVSISGIIGFVGLIIPHITRIIFGADHKILLPSSALVGAIFMLVADTLARTLISPTEIPVGIITALFGGPFFLYLLKKSRKQRT